MNFTVYNKISGKIKLSGSCQDISIQPLSDEEAIIPLASNCETQYVVDGNIFDIPPKPENFYIFDYSLKQWVPDSVLAASLVKSKRNALLATSDWTQMPDVEISTKAQWAAYRQALRDVTDQPGYPFSIVWPTPPQ
jgi:hypothetical protein